MYYYLSTNVPPSVTDFQETKAENLHLMLPHLLQVAALQRQLADANASAAEIRAATRALADLIGQATALQAMLQCYSHKIQMSQALLLKQLTSGAVMVVCVGEGTSLLCSMEDLCICYFDFFQFPSGQQAHFHPLNEPQMAPAEVWAF